MIHLVGLHEREAPFAQHHDDVKFLAETQRAGISFAELKAIKTHNPFAVNDLYFSRETGVPLERLNQFGCSLVYGHPQGPTGMRGIVELIEELALSGGGYGLFSGCAAGDTAMAAIVKVG